MILSGFRALYGLPLSILAIVCCTSASIGVIFSFMLRYCLLKTIVQLSFHQFAQLCRARVSRVRIADGFSPLMRAISSAV